MRSIDADALKKDIAENSITLEGTWAIEVECAKALIDNAPTVEERPKGKWSIDCQCSNCKKYVDYTTDFCPNCGARMER